LRALAAAELCAARLTNALLATAPPAAPPDIGDTPLPALPGDRMRCRLQAIGTDAGVALRSGGTLTGTHYTIIAGGTSLRGARAAVELGVLVVRDAAGALRSAQRAYWVRLD